MKIGINNEFGDLKTRYPCPKCLLAVLNILKEFDLNTIFIDKMMSLVCNAAPIAPTSNDPCQCGTDWLIDPVFFRG